MTGLGCTRADSCVLGWAVILEVLLLLSEGFADALVLKLLSWVLL